MSDWASELARYSPQVEALACESDRVRKLAHRLPGLPLLYLPSPIAVLALNLSTYCLWACHESAAHAAQGLQVLWRNGAILTISLPARLLYELWGAAHYARLTTEKLADPTAFEVVARRVGRLSTGARSSLPLPWGVETTAQSINVVEFVKCLSDLDPQAESEYAYLCESCHPNNLQHGYWQLMIPPRQNWSNAKFNELGHTMIKRTLSAAETALVGVELEVTSALEAALQYIE